jgi:suppressor of fused protein SUFU
MNDVYLHIEQYIGPIAAVMHDSSIQVPKVDILIVKPTEEKPYYSLITAGLSELAMSLPAQPYGNISPFIELMVSLPPHWVLPQLYEVTGGPGQSPEWYWPIGVLLFLAKVPHLYNTWFAAEQIIPNGQPPDFYAPNTRLCGSLLFPSLLAPRGFHELQINAHKKIQFLALFPLYQEEMNLATEQGIDELFDRLAQQRISDYIIPDRINVALNEMR